MNNEMGGPFNTHTTGCLQWSAIKSACALIINEGTFRSRTGEVRLMYAGVNTCKGMGTKDPKGSVSKFLKTYENDSEAIFISTHCGNLTKHIRQ